MRDRSVAPSQAVQQVDAWLTGTPGLDDDSRGRLLSDRMLWLAQGYPADRALQSEGDTPPGLLRNDALYTQIALARQARRTDVQGRAVQELLRRDPADWQARTQEIVWLSDDGRFADAQAALDRLKGELDPSNAAQRAGLLELEGLLAEGQRQPLEALQAYTALLQLQPEHRYAQRASVWLTADAGAAAAAWQRAQQVQASQPGTYSALEFSQLRQQATGQQVRWELSARTDSSTNPVGAERWQRMGPIVASLEEQLASPDLAQGLQGPQAATWYELQKSLRFDWYIVLNEVGQCDRVLEQYENWAPPLADVTNAARVVLADCYAQARQPRKAIPLYEAALGEPGHWMDQGLRPLHYGLTYAYVDAGDFERAQSLLDTLLAQTPPTIRQGPAGGQPNRDYSELLNLQAMSWLYSGQIARADTRLQQLAGLAPGSASFQLGAAESARSRLHAERSLARLEAFETDQPDNPQLIAALADTHRELHQWPEARAQLERLQRERPDDDTTEAVARRDRIDRAPLLEAEAESGFGSSSDNTATADRDDRVRLRLSSGLLRDGWRVFAEQNYARSRVDEGGSNRLARTGLGLVWDVDRWRAEAQLHQASRGPYRTGAAGRLDYRASDQWQFTLRADSASLDLPWRARAAGIGAREAALQGQYIVNESRRFLASTQFQRYSDGNRRTAWLLGWEEGWVQQPRWQFATRIDLGYSQNSLRDAVYFNPSHDWSLGVTNSLRILQWRDADRQMNHLIEFQAGTYGQAGYGAKPMAELRYGHEWNLGSGRTLTYGASASTHPYDGRSERDYGLFLNLSLPLP